MLPLEAERMDGAKKIATREAMEDLRAEMEVGSFESELRSSFR